jgi:uncharacterized membrane protein YdbT with pleckstrin-like domain
MGRYIDDILQPGEKVLYSTNAHWIFFLPAIAAWIAALVFLILWHNAVGPGLEMMWLVLAAAAGLAALFWTVRAWFHRWTTETDVTNLRVVHKTGFIRRETFEIGIDKVASVEVNQSIMGRILNYGDVALESMGDVTRTIEKVTSPLEFRSRITAR